VSAMNDGGPAFPGRVKVFMSDGSYAGEQPEDGMSFRAWLAGMALNGCCINGEPEDVKHNAIVALRNADALIAELEKGKQ
jgi:hypothetical protein